MKIKQLREIERRLPLNDATYAMIAADVGCKRCDVKLVAKLIGYKRSPGKPRSINPTKPPPNKNQIGRLQFMVRAQNAMLAFRERYARA